MTTIAPGHPSGQEARTPEPRRQFHDSRLERVTLACTGYEIKAIRGVAIQRGVIPAVATRRGRRVKARAVGAILLRTMSLQAIVEEYERLLAAGEIVEAAA
jgi:hypothetical protein